MNSGPRIHSLRIVITADKGSGKTTCIKRIADYLAERNIPHRGFFAEGFWEGDARSGFAITFLPENTTMPLCDRKSVEWPKYGNFRYNPYALSAGNRIIADTRPGEIILMDEIGRQETEGRVWSEALDIALKSTNPLILSVRRRCLEEVNERWNLSDIFLYDGTITPWESIFNKVISHFHS